MYVESYQILVLIKACVETAERFSLFRMIPHPVRALRFYLRGIVLFFCNRISQKPYGNFLFV
jgi:hypothetical protein